jgi:two-component system chemotaxis response regulator CheY
MLDLVMPRMSGAELLERARAIQRYDGLPMLIISSEAQHKAAGMLRSSGPCEILQKPLLPDSLLAAVHRLIG